MMWARRINPSNVEAQIEGGIAQGVGYALEEEIRQPGGIIENKSLVDYMMPTSMDVPKIESHIIEIPVSSGPYGAKGVGEPALIPTAPAILNAICNALDVRITDLPANLENLHRLIRNKEKMSRKTGEPGCKIFNLFSKIFARRSELHLGPGGSQQNHCRRNGFDCRP